MKVEISGSQVTVTSETKNEALNLINMAFDAKGEVKSERVKRTHRPHKRHMFKKTCDECSKVVRGNHALALHKLAHRREELRARTIPVTTTI